MNNEYDRVQNEIEQNNLIVQAVKEQKYNELLKENKQLLKERDKYKSIVDELKEKNRKLNNNIYDAIYFIKDLACYEQETHTYCNDIKYYDVHKIIKELEEGNSNE